MESGDAVLTLANFQKMVAMAEAAEDPRKRNQSQRSDLGKRLGLDVGPPNERAELANGNTAEVRDDLGLLLEPKLYANRKCNLCYGRGIVIKHQPIAAETAKKMIAKDPVNEALIHEKGDRYALRHTETCGCIRRRYTKAYDTLVVELVKAKLATLTGSRFDAGGERRPTVQLV